jgi:hypothetical protein
VTTAYSGNFRVIGKPGLGPDCDKSPRYVSSAAGCPGGRIGNGKRPSRLVCFSIDGKSPESLIEMRSPEILSSGRITANANHNRDRHEDLDDHEHSIGRTAHPVSHPTDDKNPKKACQIRAISTFYGSFKPFLHAFRELPGDHGLTFATLRAACPGNHAPCRVKVSTNRNLISQPLRGK